MLASSRGAPSWACRAASFASTWNALSTRSSRLRSARLARDALERRGDVDAAERRAALGLRGALARHVQAGRARREALVHGVGRPVGSVGRRGGALVGRPRLEPLRAQQHAVQQRDAAGTSSRGTSTNACERQCPDSVARRRGAGAAAPRETIETTKSDTGRDEASCCSGAAVARYRHAADGREGRAREVENSLRSLSSGNSPRTSRLCRSSLHRVRLWKRSCRPASAGARSAATAPSSSMDSIAHKFARISQLLGWSRAQL